MRIKNTIHLRLSVICIALLSMQACAKANVYVNENSMPQVKIENRKVESSINQQLVAYFSDFACDDGTMPDMIIDSQYLSEHYISASYSLAGYCSGNASPFEYSGGFTFDLKSGSSVQLNQLINDEGLINSAIQETYAQSKKEESCPQPDYSGEFYIKDKWIVLKEFYPEKQFAKCEFEVQLPLNK